MLHTLRVNILIILASAFFLFLLSLAIAPVRKWALGRLSMPVPSTNQALPVLDALRGLAALWVAMFHYWQWSEPAYNGVVDVFPFVLQGTKAIPVFVILSGFLIYRSAKRIRTIDDLKDYATRRLLRIYPLYLATTIACFFLFELSPDVIAKWQRFLAEALALRSIGYPDFFNPPAWSLYVEMLFYAFCPLFVVLSRQRLLQASVVIFVLLTFSDVNAPREVLLWKYFFVGIITGELIDLFGKQSERASMLFLLLGSYLLYLDVGGTNWFGESINSLCRQQRWGCTLSGAQNQAFTVGLAASIALIIIGGVNSRIVSRIFSTHPFRVLGTISYSVFLWHGIVIALAFGMSFNGHGNTTSSQTFQVTSGWPMLYLGIPSILAVGITSFLLIERPFLMLRPKQPRLP